MLVFFFSLIYAKLYSTTGVTKFCENCMYIMRKSDEVLRITVRLLFLFINSVLSCFTSKIWVTAVMSLSVFADIPYKYQFLVWGQRPSTLVGMPGKVQCRYQHFSSGDWQQYQTLRQLCTTRLPTTAIIPVPYLIVTTWFPVSPAGILFVLPGVINRYTCSQRSPSEWLRNKERLPLFLCRISDQQYG